MTFGPLPIEAGSARGWVVFAPDTCAVELGTLVMDGGPGAEDLQIVRRWDGSTWSWTADWRVADGLLRRPGRTDVPLGELVTELRTEGGRVTAWRDADVWTDVLAGVDGAFAGLRRGSTILRRTAEGFEADDGRTARFVQDDSGRVIDVTDEWGAKTRYGWDGARLTSITWADGARLRLGEGQIDGVAGRWTCTRDGTTSRIVGPGGVSWTIEAGQEETVVTDATGVTVRTRTEAGRLVGWDDPHGGRTRRSFDRGVETIRDPTGATWRIDGRPWSSMTGPDGGDWRVVRDEAGRVQSVTDPLGRRGAFERDEVGRIVMASWGGDVTRFGRDPYGRVSAIQPATGGQIRIGRDGTGRVVRVLDGSGAAWTMPRDDAGRVRRIVDPSGVTWEITRDGLGRITVIREPNGRAITMGRREDDRVASIRVGVEERWDLLRGPAGGLTGVREPTGRIWGWSRDAADRVRSVHRPDQQVVTFSRDRAGEVVVANGMRILRDPVGRPVGLALGGDGLAWSRDVDGAVVGVEGPGVHLGLGRDATGRIREVRVADQPTVQLVRDAAGRVTSASGGIAVGVDRDGAGRIVALRRDGRAAMLLDRDMRGFVSAVRIGEARWRLGRDAGGRIVDAEAPEGLRLGVDRDGAGEPRSVRIADGSLAQIARSDEAVDIVVRDAGGAIEGGAAWTWDLAGALATLRSALSWTFQRDPTGALVVMEAAGRAWSRAPDRIDGPDGAWIGLDINGAPRSGRTPEGFPAWGVGDGQISWVVGDEGEVREIAGTGGGVRLVHDGIGRLLGWSGKRVARARWDALGRLAAWEEIDTDGWGALFAWGRQVRMPVVDAAVARPGGAVLFGPNGVPVTTIHGGGLELSPGGLVLGPAAGEVAVGGRFGPIPGAALIGGTDTIDPLSGRATGGGLQLPWSATPWEVGAGVSPWADPDGSASQPWDDAGYAPTGPWASPMRILAEAGRVPGGAGASEAPGVGWLPASFGATWPEGVPDPRVWPVDEEPELRWVLDNIRNATSPTSESLTHALLAPPIQAEVRSLPGLNPALPIGFR